MTSPWCALFLQEREAATLSVVRTLSLPSQQTVQQLAASESLCYAVATQGAVYLFDISCLPLAPVPLAIPRGVKIASVACNALAVLLVADTGLVFVQGSDPEDSGVLGGLPEALVPTVFPGLEACAIREASLGASHGAALDCKDYTADGKLWTWGSALRGQLGREQHKDVLAVKATNAYKGVKVLCGAYSTVLVTSGGFLCLFGSVGGHTETSHSASLRSPPGLHNKFVVSAATGRHFLSILTDSGEVYICDDCLDAVRLPTQEGKAVSAIAATQLGVYGLSERVVYLWQGLGKSPEAATLMETLAASGHCPLLTWCGHTYQISSAFPQVSFLGNDREIAVSAEFSETRLFATFIESLPPYKRSHYITTLLQSYNQSLAKWKQAKFKNTLSPLYTNLDFGPIVSAEDSPSQYTREYKGLEAYGSQLSTTEQSRTPQYRIEIHNTAETQGKRESAEEHIQSVSPLPVIEEYENLVSFSSADSERQSPTSKTGALPKGKKPVKLAAGRQVENSETVPDKRQSLLQSLSTKHESRIRQHLYRSLFVWRTDKVKLVIKADGLERLVRSLQTVTQRLSLHRLRTWQRRKDQQREVLSVLIGRLQTCGSKLKQHRAFSRWKDAIAREKYENQRKLKIVTAGARAFGSRLKLFLRKNVFRVVIARLMSAERRSEALSRYKYPLAFLEMKVAKVQRRMENFAFNRIFSTQRDPKWTRYREALSELQSLTARRLRSVFSDLNHDTDSRFIRLVIALVPLAAKLKRLRDAEVRSAWGLIWSWRNSPGRSTSSREAEVDDLESWEGTPSRPPVSPDFLLAHSRRQSQNTSKRTPSPSKASLRIPSISGFSSPRDAQVLSGERCTLHRTSYSNRELPPRAQSPKKKMKVWTKPPWKWPSTTASFDAPARVTSPRSRQAQYMRELRDRINRQKVSEFGKLTGDTMLFAISHSSNTSRTQSPDLPQTSRSGSPNYLPGRYRLSPRNGEESGYSYVASTMATSPRDTSVQMILESSSQKLRIRLKELVKMLQNLKFSMVFRAFAAVKEYAQHAPPRRRKPLTPRSEAEIETEWHQRIFIIGSEKLRKLVDKLRKKRIKTALIALFPN